MKSFVRFAPVLVIALAACGSSSTSTSTSTSPFSAPAASGPPLSLSLITPGPGLPTVVPSSTVYVATSPSPPVQGTATLTPSSPAPAPSGADLAALAAGKAPSAAYFASLSAAQTSAVTALGTTGAPRGVMGTILEFLSNGFTVRTSTGDLSAALNAGAAYAAEFDAAGASQVVVHVTGQTVDAVPGGFGALRIGTAVLIAGSGPPANFTAVAVVANPGGVVTPNSVARLGDADLIRTTQKRRRQLNRRQDNSVRQETPFALTRTFGYPGITAPNPPYSANPTNFGCVIADTTAFVTAGFGKTANYPMQLQDVSDLTTYVEGKEEPLPVRLVDAPGTGTTTYRVNYGISLNLTANLILFNCGAVKNSVYNLSIVTVGQAIESDSQDPLPAKGETVTAMHNSCPFVPVPLGGVSKFLVNLPTPSISACFDFELTGDTIEGNATITNAKLISVPNSNGMTDTSWMYQSDLPDGDPDVTLVPAASPTDGSMQPNVLSLSGMSDNLGEGVTPSFTFCLYADICSSPLTSVQLLEPSVFQRAIGSGAFVPIMGIEQPSPVMLTLMPTDAEVPIKVH